MFDFEPLPRIVVSGEETKCTHELSEMLANCSLAQNELILIHGPLQEIHQFIFIYYKTMNVSGIPRDASMTSAV